MSVNVQKNVRYRAFLTLNNTKNLAVIKLRQTFQLAV